MSQPEKIPGPDHPITIEKGKARIVVTVAGQIVADSHDTMTLQESTYPAVHYIPRKDVNMSLLERTAHSTHCPYKGDAAYYSIPIGGKRSVNAIWSYEDPYEPAEPIKGYLAFYPDRVDSIEEKPGK